MNLGFGRALPALVLIVAAGCGARSQLYGSETAGDGGGGAGGGATTTTGQGGTTTTTTTTGQGGTTTTTTEGGGGTGPCAALEYKTPFASLVGGMKPHQRNPKLALSKDDNTRVTVATAWQFVDTPFPPLELRRTSFEPWFEFPAGSGLGNTNKMDLDGGASFAIAQSPGDRFALLFADFQQAPPGGLRFSADFDPNQPNPPATLLLDEEAQTALFLTFGQARFFWGGTFKFPNEDLYVLKLGLVDPDGSPQTSLELGCGTTPPLADAVPSVGGHHLALTTSPDCISGMGAGPSNSLVIVHVKENGSVSPVAQMDTVDTEDLHLAARSDGAWVVWTHKGGEDLPPSIRLGLVKSGEAFTLLPAHFALFQPGSVATASFEDHLIVAWIEPEPEGASPRVQVFLPDGTPAGSIKVQATAKAIPPLALLGSPFERQAVLAWSEEIGDPQLGDQLRITRIDCLDK